MGRRAHVSQQNLGNCGDSDNKSMCVHESKMIMHRLTLRNLTRAAILTCALTKDDMCNVSISSFHSSPCAWTRIHRIFQSLVQCLSSIDSFTSNTCAWTLNHRKHKLHVDSPRARHHQSPIIVKYTKFKIACTSLPVAFHSESVELVAGSGDSGNGTNLTCVSLRGVRCVPYQWKWLATPSN